MPDFEIDVAELFKRTIKYIFEGTIVALAAFFLPGRKLDIKDILIIGVIAAATFSMLDLFAPSIGSSVRSGAGMSIGVGLTGGLPTSAPGPFLS